MRDLSSSITDEMAKDAVRLGLLVAVEFASGTVRIWSGNNDLNIGDDIYTGVGNVLGFDKVEESTSLKAINAVITVPVTTAFISLALQEPYQGRKAEIYLSTFDENGILIGDPYPFFSGFCDVMSIEAGEETATIGLTLESEMVDLFRPRERNYTSEDQKRFYPDDMGLDFIPAIQDVEVVWNAQSKTATA